MGTDVVVVTVRIYEARVHVIVAHLMIEITKLESNRI